MKALLVTLRQYRKARLKSWPWIFAYTVIAFSNAFASEDNSYAAIAKRLATPTIVDIMGEAKKIENTITDAARPERGGNETFNLYCTVCHGTGAAGSPKFGCKSAWEPRKAKGMKTLLQHAMNGFNFMPAKGTCLDCSQNEIEDAIHYMIDNSSKDDSACAK
ncbi:MAG: cytochrome c5 family protein [Gammaproteobacteria bacterium]|jgi:cytochrome c5|nr:cytochrome c5 family protein [Gammaproteobacteria bacterium]